MNNGKKNILVVDDDADITGLVKQGLEYLYPTEYHVICVNCGKKCFEVLEKNDQIPDIILLDIKMPDMDGLEVFDYLKLNSKWKVIPVIFLSEETDRDTKRNSKSLGDDFVEKPFEIENLKLRIEKVLER
jgi:DNA-binding response OmpR family regulator